MAESSLIALVFVFFLFFVASSESKEEAAALLKWKASLPIINKARLLTSWTFPPNNTTGFEPCTLPGIHCQDGSVSRIGLAYSGIVGTLHEFPFSSFHNLKQLDLSSNELYGSIPPQISQLTKLIYLDLSHNQLSGNIPAEIGLLTHLDRLQLGYNLLNGSISNIPTSLGNLISNMTYLDLSYNLLTDILHEFPFSFFHNLAYLDLSSNELHGSLPPQISQLTKLIDLNLSNNKLSGNIPPEIGQLPHLQLLRLANNQLNGSITREIGKLKSLTELSLISNNLEGLIPTCLGNLSNMIYLYLSYNFLTGSIPPEIGNLSNLLELYLTANHLTGPIPSTFGKLKNLTTISLSKNQISGSIPKEIGNLKSLQTISLFETNLSGTIPKSLGDLTKLTFLSLHSNRLGGSIPKELGNLVSLVNLELYNNQLNGFVPATLGKLNNLETIDLNNNRFSGLIPPEFGSTSPNLEYLDLSSNSFSQEIPITLMKLHRLYWLDLSNNLLIGYLPSSISDLERLENLNLSHNRLSGGIPVGFNNTHRWSQVDLSYNNLEGRIPDGIVYAGFEAVRGNKNLCGIQGLKRCNHEIAVLVTLPLLLGALVLAFAVTGIFIIRRSKRKEDPQAEGSSAYDECLSWISSAFDGRIMYEEIIKATNNFDATYRIGRGGYGTVYKAELPSAGIVAVKKFHSLGDGEHAFRKEFLNEIKALLEIKHRNIVKLHGFCSNARHSFLVYEYLERGSLASFLRREETAKELDWIKRLNIVKGVARALSYLHHDCFPPIVHRDISSSNILLDSKYEAHVSDFGTAKLIKTDSSNWSTIAGTYGYIAPEFAYMMKVTKKCDVYSFGVLSMEVIKGEHPGEILESLLSIRIEEKMAVKDVLDQRLPSPSSEIKYELTVILELAKQCLSSNPKHRPTMHMICQQLLTRFGFQDPTPQVYLD